MEDKNRDRRDKCGCGGLKFKRSKQCSKCYRSSGARTKIKTPKNLK